MTRFSRALLAVGGLAALVCGVFFWKGPGPTEPVAPSPLPKISAPPTASEGPREPVATRAAETVPANPATRLAETLAQLRASQDPQANRRLLAALRAYLGSLPTDTASRVIQQFLAGNSDASTRLDLTIQPGGKLGDASSLRVFLLDYLGQIDKPAGGAVAAKILAQYTTPDEWAVSLRNYAWANPGAGGDSFLLGRMRALLGNSAWRTNPSVGYLEAFDTIVHARGTMLAPELAGLVRNKEEPAAAHAAYLTLDRLVIAEPEATLQQLLDRPELMQGREQTRANFFARADVRQPAQRALLERYLLDPARQPGELATFAGLYPSGNYMISTNLLTKAATPSRDDLVAHDRAALETVELWEQDARFERLKPQLGQIRRRLAEFVRQAGGGK